LLGPGPAPPPSLHRQERCGHPNSSSRPDSGEKGKEEAAHGVHLYSSALLLLEVQPEACAALLGIEFFLVPQMGLVED
jgi:hypothetical protein